MYHVSEPPLDPLQQIHLLALEHPVQNPLPVNPRSRLLSINVHWNRSQSDCRSSSANDIKGLPNALDRNPVIGVESQSESEQVLDEVHDGESFSGLFTMAVADVGDDRGGSELDAQVDHSHADDNWNRPGVAAVEGLAPGEEAGGNEEEVCEHDWEAEFRF